MHEAGMPAIEIIQSATLSSAKLLRIADKLGSIKVGKLADLVAVDGDPLENKYKTTQQYQHNTPYYQ